VNTRALILAAGRGNRISAVSRGTPKPLLPLDGKEGGYTFLDFHLAALDRAGVSEVVIAGNQVTYGTELRVQREKKLSEKFKVSWVLNPTEDLSTSGSAHSAQFAFHARPDLVSGESRLILMDADILYDPNLMQYFLSAQSKRSKSLVCSQFRNSQEEVVVFGRSDGSPVVHGKGMIGTPLTRDLTVLGEATGVVLFEPEDQQDVLEVTDWLIRYSTAKARSEHEDLTARMMANGRMDAVVFGSEYAFMECDSPEEYEVLIASLYPQVRGFLETQ
jgi:choline kinase